MAARIDYERQAARTLRGMMAARGRPRGLTRVLLPFDGSRAAHTALEHVVENLQGLRTQVTLLNVQNMGGENPSALMAARGIEAVHREAGLRVLAPAAERLAQAGIDHATQVAFGPAAETIVDAAYDQGCELIVIGTRGRSALASLVSGSVPRRVARIARTPVMLVGPEGAPDIVQLPAPLRAPFIAA